MAFWSNEKFKLKAPQCALVTPFDSTRIVSCAYELALGPEAFLTSDEGATKTALEIGQQTVIPPGQFALLLTEETVVVPEDVLAFISIKAGIKFRGLINVSGFHVDPGFSGRLKFAVYNAGSQNIILQRGQPVFLLWCSDLDRATGAKYQGEHNHQSGISAEDVMRLQGEIASPGQLRKELNELENKVKLQQWMITIICSGLVGLAFLFLRVFPQPVSRPVLPQVISSETTNTPVPPIRKPVGQP